MEDILASIRRILSEDEPAPLPAEAKPATPAEQSAPQTESDDVLVLDASMLAPEQASGPEREEKVEMPPPPAIIPPAVLVAPEAAAAAASSVGSLVRTLTAERTQVRSGGPTIEDIVREEIRPLLKDWLDTNLPPLVERLVRAEIERVVGRAVP